MLVDQHLTMFLLFLVVLPSHQQRTKDQKSLLSDRIDHGCYIKQARRAVGAKMSGWPKWINSTEDCARECSIRKRCDTIGFNPSTKMCSLLENGRLSNGVSGDVAGWCPKGERADKVDNNNVEASPLRCGLGEDQVCKFPFKLNGEVEWECVGGNNVTGNSVTGNSLAGNRTKNASERNATVCNVDQEGKPELQEIVNKPAASLHVCKECDACISSRVKYEGYSLKRHNGNNVYSWVNTVEECQLLCQITKGCNFFNIDLASGNCWLKHGVGVKKTTGSLNDNFGAKYCPG